MPRNTPVYLLWERVLKLMPPNKLSETKCGTLFLQVPKGFLRFCFFDHNTSRPRLVYLQQVHGACLLPSFGIMPTYNALGISASLLVTDLDKTLSDEIVLRMGASQQKDAKRIESALSKGRALVEQPLASNDSKVGVLQLVGDYEDMALFAVEAGGAQNEHDGDVKHDITEQGNPLKESDLELMSTNDATLSLFSPTQDAPMRKSSKSSFTSKNIINDGNSYPDALSTGANFKTSDKIACPKAVLSGDQMRPGFSQNPTKQLALCLKVDCAKFYEHDNKELRLLGGKDIKFEVFINGQLVDVAFESSRPGKRNGILQFHGTRIHRQSEKPWIYESPASESSSACDQRWVNINQLLKQEASTRGVNKQNERPLTAQFLTTLARSQLPATVRAKGRRFAVIDLVITAGRGRKFGAETTYITEPSRLLNKKFSGVAPIVGHIEPHHDDDEEDLTLQSDYFMANGEYIFNSDSEMFKGIRTMSAEQLHASADPHTHTAKQNIRDHSSTLDTIPTQRNSSNHEKSSGHSNGKRTLRQRFHDIAMASKKKKKRGEALESVKQELDDGIADIFMSARNMELSIVAPSEPQDMQFLDDLTGPAFMDDNDEPDLNKFVTTPDALDRTLPQVNPFWLEEESFGPKPQFRTMKSTNNDSGHDRILAAGDPMQLMLTPPKETSKSTGASALSSSPISIPMKYNTSRRKRQVDTSTNDHPVRSSKRAVPSPRTPQRSVDTPNRTSKRWHPDEQTPEQALGTFDVPDLCKGSAVTYADGLKQRQVSKARGGEFEEQEFVVGMRFIVL